MTSSELLGPATTRWNDYVGTAAADDSDAITSIPSLYELAGLDREQWRIVGVDLTVRQTQPQVVVYAAQHGAGTVDDLLTAGGELPVTAFELAAATDVEAFLNDAFKRVAIRLVARGFRDETLQVIDRVQHSADQP